MAAPTWLPASTDALLSKVVDTLVHTLDGSLQSAVLVGSAMNPRRHDRARHPEVLAIVDAAPEEKRGPGHPLRTLSLALSPLLRQGGRVRLLTKRELLRSADVFALEIAEWKEHHHLLHGQDPFETVEIRPSDLRHAIEMELRGLVRRARNRMIVGIATRREQDDPQRALLEALDRYCVAGYFTLRMLGEEPAQEEGLFLAQLAEKANRPNRELQEEVGRLRGGMLVDLEGLLGLLLPSVSALAELVDGLS